jgi:RNA polymerase-interacting CarD/CdnL/TRCF family regulator
MMVTLGLIVCVTVAAVFVTGIQSVNAQGADPRKEAARMAQRARTLAEEGELDEALDLLKKSYELDPHPSQLYNMARLNQRIGNLKEAAKLFRLHSEIDPDAERARRSLERLEEVRSMMQGELIVTSSPEEARILIDGVDAGPTNWGPVPIAHGLRRVKVTAPGYLPYEEEVFIEGGSRVELPHVLLMAVKVEKGKKKVAKREEPKPIDRAGEGKAQGRQGNEVVGSGVRTDIVLHSVEPTAKVLPWPWVTAGAGGLAVIVGGVFTHYANKEQDKFDKVRMSAETGTGTDVYWAWAKPLLEEIQDKKDRNDTASAVLYAIGGAAVVAGVVWGIVDLTRKPANSKGTVIAPIVMGDMARGESMVGVSGRF